jgi:hypothetical protein
MTCSAWITAVVIADAEQPDDRILAGPAISVLMSDDSATVPAVITPFAPIGPTATTLDPRFS